MDDILKRILGGIGNQLTTVGTNYNLPQLRPGGLGIQLQQVGASALTPEQRIQKSIQNTGGIAEGDYNTAVNMGVPLGNLSSRADGGILTNNQMAQNYQTAARNTPSYEQQFRQQFGNDAYMPPGWKPEGATSTDTGQDFAYEAWRSAIDQANRIRNSGRATFDDLIKAVGAFRDRAKTQRDDSGQEITNRFGEIMGQTGLMGRQTATDAARRGRALGLGDSSKFRNQNLVAGNLALQQGGNLAKRGENERANEALYQERLDQAQGQEDQANRYLRDINDYASGVETQGMHNYANTLSSLIDRANQLAALKPLNAGSLQAYQTDTSGLTNVLNGLLGSMQSRQISGGDMAANLANPVDIFSLNDPRRNRGLVK